MICNLGDPMSLRHPVYVYSVRDKCPVRDNSPELVRESPGTNLADLNIHTHTHILTNLHAQTHTHTHTHNTC